MKFSVSAGIAFISLLAGLPSEVSSQPCPCSVSSSFSMYNADKDSPIHSYLRYVGNGAEIFERHFEVSFEAEIYGEGCTSKEQVEFELTGPRSHSRTERKRPFMAFGNKDGDIKGRALKPGSYHLSAKLVGSECGSSEIDFQVVNAPSCPCWSEGELDRLPYPEPGDGKTSWNDVEIGECSSGEDKWCIDFADGKGRLCVEVQEDEYYFDEEKGYRVSSGSRCKLAYIKCDAGGANCESLIYEPHRISDAMTFDVCEEDVMNSGFDRGFSCFISGDYNCRENE